MNSNDAPTRRYALSDKGQPINTPPIEGLRKSELISQALAQTLRELWTAGVNHRGGYGQWAFAEFTDVYAIQAKFDALVERLSIKESVE